MLQCLLKLGLSIAYNDAINMTDFKYVSLSKKKPFVFSLSPLVQVQGIMARSQMQVNAGPRQGFWFAPVPSYSEGWGCRQAGELGSLLPFDMQVFPECLAAG